MRAEVSANSDSLAHEIAALPWFHQIDFGGGLLSPGQVPIKTLRVQADSYFPKRLDGLTVLDIGCWDGFNSIEAYRRGAARVLATDHTVWHPPFWGNRKSVELARARLAPDMEIMDIDLPDLSLETVGAFDIVLFCGVLYHLENPVSALRQIRPLVKRTLVLETHMDASHVKEPAAIFYPEGYGGDWSNWWGPNKACVEGMLRRTGFSEIRFTPHPLVKGRGIFHATAAGDM